MERLENKKPSQIEITGIPDNDIPGWYEALHRGGFSQEEIEEILAYANREFAERTGKKVLKHELAKTVEYIEKTYNRRLSKEEIEHLKVGVEERLRKEQGE